MFPSDRATLSLGHALRRIARARERSHLAEWAGFRHDMVNTVLAASLGDAGATRSGSTGKAPVQPANKTAKRAVRAFAATMLHR